MVTPRAGFTIGLTVGSQPPIRRVRTTLRIARALRFDVAWVVDHFTGFYPRSIWDRDFSWMADPDQSPDAYFDYQTLLGNLAARAGRMRLAVGVTEPIRRHPLLIAQALMTLAHLTRRPPILGLGAGERENVEPYGLPFDQPVARLEEAVGLIKAAFVSQGPLRFEGRRFPVTEGSLDLTPPDGHTPELWIAAHGPRMLQLVGEQADGWYPTMPMNPSEYESRLGAIHTAATTSGRDPSTIVPGYQAFVVIGRTERGARAMLDTRPVRFAALLAPAETWHAAGVAHPFGPDYRGFVDFVPHRHGRTELEAAIAAVPVDLLAERVPWGTPDRVLEIFGDFRDAGLRHLVLQPVSALVSRRDALFSLRAMVRIQRRLRGPVPSSE